MNLRSDWPQIRRLVNRAFSSSLHFAVATTNEDGSPHVTPIGSLLLDRDAPRGVYFELFTQRLAENLEARPRVTILAVDSRRWLWLRALARGSFASPPAVRLLGSAGPRRKATEMEVSRWVRRVRLARALPGYSLLWGRGQLTHVRELHFDDVERVELGAMTARRG